jgi:hypothetical protein
MFDFSKLKLVKISNDSFVGIRKSSTGEELEFHLPNGFEDFPEENFDEIKNLFFRMYRTFKKFECDNIDTNRLRLNTTEFQRDQDQTILSPGGVSIQTGEGECVLYSKIKMLERILEAYDDLAINSIQKKNRRSEDIDYSRIHRYLDRAIYLQDDVIYIDSMELPRPSIQYESTDLINLYCYILDEIVQQLDGDVAENINARLQDIKFLAQQFRDDYLTINQSIFDKDTFSETIIILKEALDNIDKNTYYKDPDYWQLYEAIEIFLYGEINPNQSDGDFWGIRGFSMLWEDMCNTFFFKTCRDDILYADTDISIKGDPNSEREYSEQNRVGNNSTHDGSKSWSQWIYRNISNIPYPDTKGFFGWNELLCIELDLKPGTLVYNNRQDKYFKERDRSNTKFRRFPRPDLILKDCDSHLYVRIIDYKYVPLSFYTSQKLSEQSQEKFRVDIIKQLTYELAIQQTHEVLENWFFIPYFYESAPRPFLLGKVATEVGEISTSVRTITGQDTNIKIFKANFLFIQKAYLDENS